ncbi:MAG: agmatinase [Acidobacteria bacterium]|nr:agmatinase [Acidobacteriota bacterium]
MTAEPARRRPVLIGLPYDASSSHLRGSAGAPPAIRAALRSPAGNWWTEALQDLAAPGGLADAGDLALPPNAGAWPLIEAGIGRILDNGEVPIALGGDHSVTYPILRALGPRHPGLTILHIDAHPDLYDHFEGDRHSHACPFARIMEEGLAARLVQVGIRAMTGHQRDQAAKFGVDVIDMRAWAAGVRPTVRGPIYASIDLDGIDPAFAPGVAHREPGGLTVRECLDLIQRLPLPLAGADVVELNPGCDPSGITATLAAKLVKELAGRMMGDVM